MRLFLIAASLVAVQGTAYAQHNHGHHGGAAPYSGFERREVKALSADQISDLRNGRGMGWALAAELNGYPGPLHVLELADKLALAGDVRLRVRALFDEMKAESIAMGAILIAHEAELDSAFAEKSISQEVLSALTDRIGRTQARLRAIHLKYHLSTTGMLTRDQRRRYAELRGYR